MGWTAGRTNSHGNALSPRPLLPSTGLSFLLIRKYFPKDNINQKTSFDPQKNSSPPSSRHIFVLPDESSSAFWRLLHGRLAALRIRGVRLRSLGDPEETSAVRSSRSTPATLKVCVRACRHIVDTRFPHQSLCVTGCVYVFRCVCIEVNFK